MASQKPSPNTEKVSELRNLVARYDEHADFYTNASKNYNEHSCRDNFINPFLEILGWDVSNVHGVAPQYREVITENFFSETGRPDYTLTVSGTPIYFIEAKKPSVDIRKAIGPASQARKYGWNANHSIVVLTNFEDLAIYNVTVMPNANEGPDVALFRRYNHTCFWQESFFRSGRVIFSGLAA